MIFRKFAFGKYAFGKYEFGKYKLGKYTFAICYQKIHFWIFLLENTLLEKCIPSVSRR